MRLCVWRIREESFSYQLKVNTAIDLFFYRLLWETVAILKHTHTHTHTHTRTHACTHARTYSNTHSQTQLYVSVWLCVGYVCVCVCRCVCACVCVCVCVPGCASVPVGLGMIWPGCQRAADDWCSWSVLSSCWNTHSGRRYTLLGRSQLRFGASLWTILVVINRG